MSASTATGGPADKRVLVVGAGIAGLGLARALRGRGVGVAIVEREPGWIRDGHGIYLQANAVRALRTLGLEEAVVERATPIRCQRFLDYRGRLLFEVDLRGVWRDVGPCLALLRRDLHAVLLSHGDPVPVRMGAPVHEISQSDEKASVVLEDGAVGRFDLVVGADGIHSTVRNLTFGADRVRPLGRMAWRFVVDRDSGVRTWTTLLGRRATFLAIPVGPGRLSCYCDVRTRSPGDLHARTETRDRLVEVLAGFAGPVPGILRAMDATTAVHVAPLEEVDLPRASRGSVLLIGDAANAASPNMAQGAAMALEDGLVLAECLAMATDARSALADHEARRRGRTSWVRARTHRRDHMRDIPPPVRNLLLRGCGRMVFRTDYRPLASAP